MQSLDRVNTSQHQCKDLQASLQALNNAKLTHPYEIVPFPPNCKLKFTKNKLAGTRSASDKTNFTPPLVTIICFHKPHEALKRTGKETQENSFTCVTKRKLNISELLRISNASFKLPPRAQLTLVAIGSLISTEMWNRSFLLVV